MVPKLNALDRILDTSNVENVVLFCASGNCAGRGVEFEQIAIVPYKEEVYVLLKPVEKFEGIGDDEASLFLIKEENGEFLLNEVNNKNITDVIFEIYTKMWYEKRCKCENLQLFEVPPTVH